LAFLQQQCRWLEQQSLAEQGRGTVALFECHDEVHRERFVPSKRHEPSTAMSSFGVPGMVVDSTHPLSVAWAGKRIVALGYFLPLQQVAGPPFVWAHGCTSMLIHADLDAAS